MVAAGSNCKCRPEYEPSRSVSRPSSVNARVFTMIRQLSSTAQRPSSNIQCAFLLRASPFERLEIFGYENHPGLEAKTRIAHQFKKLCVHFADRFVNSCLCVPCVLCG